MRAFPACDFWLNIVAVGSSAGVFLRLIMPIDACEKCGSEILPGVRFCRKCGHPTGNNPTAAATQSLGATPSLGAPTTVLNPNQTKPVDDRPVPANTAPRPVPPQNTQPRRSKLLIMIAVLLVIFTTTFMYFVVIRDKTETGGSQQTAGTNGSQPGSTNTPAGIPQNLIYPGSKPGMSVSRQNRTIAQYETSDPIGKVIDWYKYKMKVTDLKLTSSGQQAVLTLDKSTVTLTSGGKITNITITQER